MHRVAATLVFTAALAVAFASAPSFASAQVCQSFTGMSSPLPGTYQPSPWSFGVGAGFPPPAYFTLTNYAASAFYVQAYPSGEESLYAPGSPTDFTIVAYASGLLPTYFSMTILPGAGDVEITALDPDGDPIFYQLIPGGTSFEPVVIEDQGPIAEVQIVNGDNETWIDDICID